MLDYLVILSMIFVLSLCLSTSCPASAMQTARVDYAAGAFGLPEALCCLHRIQKRNLEMITDIEVLMSITNLSNPQHYGYSTEEDSTPRQIYLPSSAEALRSIQYNGNVPTL